MNTRTLLSGGILLLLLALWLLWPRGGEPEAAFDYITAKARELDRDSARVRAFVESDIAVQPYAGRLRGPVGTLWSGAGSAADRDALLAALLKECGEEAAGTLGPAHTLEVELGGVKRTYDVGDLVGRPLVVRLADTFTLSAHGEESVLVGTGDTLRLTHRHGDTAHTVRRVLLPGVHVVVVAPGRVPEWALEKERELIADWDRDVAAAYLLALTHAAKSDRALGKLETHFETKAHYAEPRLLIGSTHEGVQTLDLRRNRIVADKTEFQVTRSFLEAQLEGTVLSEAVQNAGVLTALDVMAEHLERHRASTLHRVRLYKDLLARLGRQPAGSQLTLGADEERRVVLEHVGGGAVKVASMHEGLRRAMDGKPVPFALLKDGKAAPDAHGLLALELEALLGPAAGGALDYNPTADLAESTAALVRTDARFFTYRLIKGEKEPRLTLEHQFRRVDPDGGFQYESIDYWDEVNKRAYRLSQTYDVPKKAVLDTHVISTWYDRRRYRANDQFLMFSRAMIKELKEQGFTIARYRDRNFRLSEPLKLWLCEKTTARIFLNSKPYDVPALLVAGNYASANEPKKKYADVAKIDDPTFKGTAMNKWLIVDDDRFPLVNVTGTRVQTTIPARATSAATGLGVPGATIAVGGVRGVTGADGRVLLPVIKKPFDVFKVRAEARGYAPTEVEVDFRKPDAFPLALTMTPVPDPETFVRVDAKTLAALDRIDDEHLRGLVRMSIEDTPGSFALVPVDEVAYGPAATRAWILVEPDRLHMSFATADGLFGVVGDVMDWVNRNPKKVFQALVGKVPGPKEVQGSVISAYSGYIASWYAYSAGKLDALSGMMQGHEFNDLGHAHAIGFALNFLKSMEKGLDSFAAKHMGANGDAFKEGFHAGLRFFDSHPEYKGR